MRLHHLTITAFGPFADTVTVDFDALSGAGLFLLSGATGAGKSSVLDAICFALYGAVPGERNEAKRLRSDLAGDSETPRVQLEATLSGRRFKIIRSPSWKRPKRRGTGTTTEQASVVISELRDGTWHPLSTRMDEAGHLITQLLGMNLTQFTQVAMLPQGRFQAFLRATSEQRHALLQQLFDTGRFERVERWLRDHRLALKADDDQHRKQVADLVSRISETAAADELPDDFNSPRSAVWASDLAAAAKLTHELATADLPDLNDAEAAARQAKSDAEADSALRTRWTQARAEHKLLEAQSAKIEAASVRLELARRAHTLAPLHALVRTCSANRDSLAASHRALLTDCQLRLGDGPAEDEAIDRAITETSDRLASARAALPREQQLADLRRQRAEVVAQQQTLQHEYDDLTAAAADAPRLLDELRTQVEAARRATERLEASTAAVELAETRLAAGKTLLQTRNDLVTAQLELNHATARCLTLRERLNEIQQMRIDGMAAEIAHSLAVGGRCPVCGSTEHPHKATALPGAPDAAVEKQVRAELDDAEVIKEAHAGHARDLETHAHLAEQRAGSDDTDRLNAELARAVEEMTTTRALAAQATDLASQLSAREGSHHQAAQRLTTLSSALASAETRRDSLTEQQSAIAAEVDALLDPAHETIAQMISALERDLVVFTDARSATTAIHNAEQAIHDSGAALAAAAQQAGFTTVAEALASIESEPVMAELSDKIAAHQTRLVELETVLNDPAYSKLPDHAPDLPAITEQHRDAAAKLTAGRARAELAATRHERLKGLADRLDHALEEWAPTRDDLSLVTELSSFVEGKSADNQWQMRLSAYVLAYRLAQVVDAANVRLAGMSDQRYSLQHSGKRGAGERRGGLSLLIRDDWSGETRDPVTLSGGETFVVSLALALGLADVITHEAGGADLDTLFVDEGFGSLDADTLDDVMDTLDSLRDGGRVVGVVSHVAEMRDRIPTQLLVAKSRRGSTLSLNTG